MSMIRGFDASEHEPYRDRCLLQAGEYEAVITRSEEKTTRAGDGRFLELTFEITKGVHRGHELIERLNLRNPSKAAVRIACCKLGDICRAIGVLQPDTLNELHGVALVIHVRCENRGDNGANANVISGYSPLKKSSQSSRVDDEEDSYHEDDEDWEDEADDSVDDDNTSDEEDEEDEEVEKVLPPRKSKKNRKLKSW